MGGGIVTKALVCARPLRVFCHHTLMQYMIVGMREALYYMRRRISERTLALIRKARISGVVTGTFEEFNGRE